MLEDGFADASVDGDICRPPLSDAKFYPLYALCCDPDVPVILTTGPAPIPGVHMERTAPVHVDRIAADFPDLRLVV